MCDENELRTGANFVISTALIIVYRLGQVKVLLFIGQVI